MRALAPYVVATVILSGSVMLFAGQGSNPIRAQLQQGSGVHGSLFWNHNNSVFSARSFFQVGPVKPARENQYGATLGIELWEGGYFTFTGSEDKTRGNVNGTS